MMNGSKTEVKYLVIASLVAAALAIAGCGGGFAPTLPSPEGEINQSQNTFTVQIGDQFVLDAVEGDFEVYDRETDADPWVRRQIWKFEPPSQQQFSQANVCLVLDCSGSMGGQRFTDMKNAAKLFVSLMRTDDMTAIVRFSSDTDVSVVQAFTSNQSALNTAIDSMPLGNMTALYDGIGLGIQTVDALVRAGVKAVVALTDGQENDSVNYTTRASVISAATAVGIPVYAIGFQVPYQSYADDMEAIAVGTGGQFWEPATAQELEDAFQQISEIVQAGYTIGWYTTILSGQSGIVKFICNKVSPPEEIVMNFTVP